MKVNPIPIISSQDYIAKFSYQEKNIEKIFDEFYPDHKDVMSNDLDEVDHD